MPEASGSTGSTWFHHIQAHRYSLVATRICTLQFMTRNCYRLYTIFHTQKFQTIHPYRLRVRIYNFFDWVTCTHCCWQEFIGHGAPKCKIWLIWCDNLSQMVATFRFCENILMVLRETAGSRTAWSMDGLAPMLETLRSRVRGGPDKPVRKLPVVPECSRWNTVWCMESQICCPVDPFSPWHTQVDAIPGCILRNDVVWDQLPGKPWNVKVWFTLFQLGPIVFYVQPFSHLLVSLFHVIGKKNMWLWNTLIGKRQKNLYVYKFAHLCCSLKHVFLFRRLIFGWVFWSVFCELEFLMGFMATAGNK